ncbi:MAG TPA: glycine--tRNA ligase [Candidatus Paceibacterota bacterium]|nr:glycine--tRNA ligase [Candidatus Paceibacterota bacterium]
MEHKEHQKGDKKEGQTMESLISLCKRRGFIFPGSDIYGGLAGTWDYGPLGVALKQNVKDLWWKRFVTDREDMYGMDAAILMRQEVWKASGHVGGFSDPLVECSKCKRRFRADQLPEEDRKQSKCPECGGKLGAEKQFNMMFQTHVGATTDDASVSYLRPETAQGMFVNFKNLIDTFHPVLPFGMAQIGKAFRNEIAPRDFVFRTREFEQMEIEYFVHPDAWKASFEHFVGEVRAFTRDVGLPAEKIHEYEVPAGDLAHYSKRTIDFEFDYPFGKKELYGLAYRTDFDLRAHSAGSGVDLSYFDEEAKARFVPHVIEPSFGVDRTILAILTDAYREDELGGEKRVYLKLSPNVAPIKVAVFPLLKNKEALTAKAREIYAVLRKEIGAVEYDQTGSIGKRYRRQDEIGTPYCVTVDFDTLEKDGNPVTVRDRDTGAQEKIALKDLVSYLQQKLGR